MLISWRAGVSWEGRQIPGGANHAFRCITVRKWRAESGDFDYTKMSFWQGWELRLAYTSRTTSPLLLDFRLPQGAVSAAVNFYTFWHFGEHLLRWMLSSSGWDTSRQTFMERRRQTWTVLSITLWLIYFYRHGKPDRRDSRDHSCSPKRMTRLWR